MTLAALVCVAIPKDTTDSQARAPEKTEKAPTMVSRQANDAASEGDHFLAAAVSTGKSRAPHLVDARSF